MVRLVCLESGEGGWVEGRLRMRGGNDGGWGGGERVEVRLGWRERE